MSLSWISLAVPSSVTLRYVRLSWQSPAALTADRSLVRRELDNEGRASARCWNSLACGRSDSCSSRDPSLRVTFWLFLSGKEKPAVSDKYNTLCTVFNSGIYIQYTLWRIIMESFCCWCGKEWNEGVDELGEGCGVDEEDRERDFDGGGGGYWICLYMEDCWRNLCFFMMYKCWYNLWMAFDLRSNWYSLRSMNNCAFEIFTVIFNFEGNEYSFSQTHRSTFLFFNSSSNSLILKILFSTSRGS